MIILLNYLEKIKEINYAICKFDVPYMPDNFPKQYPIGKDLDMYVSIKDFSKLCTITQDFVNHYNKTYKIKTLFISTENVRFRLEINNKLYFQFDITKDNDNLLDNKILKNDLFYILSYDNELRIREIEIKKNPHKIHHIDWMDTNTNKTFCGFIWSPIFKSFLEILTDLNKNFKVKEFYIYKFKKDEDIYEKSILDIYTTDDIDPTKVKNVKLKNMKPYSNNYIYFIFENKEPKYRIKKKFNSLISTVVESIKLEIRNKYKSKVDNYVHDITIHVSDNYKQTKEIENIMKRYEDYKVDECMNIKDLLKYQYLVE